MALGNLHKFNAPLPPSVAHELLVLYIRMMHEISLVKLLCYTYLKVNRIFLIIVFIYSCNAQHNSSYNLVILNYGI